MTDINDVHNVSSTAKRSKPIPIARPRAVSPSSSPSAQPKSPILSYFFPLPTKQSAAVQVPTSPLDSLSKAFVTDAPEGMSYPNDIEPPLVRHARRLSSTWSQSSGAAVRFSAAAAATGSAAVSGVATGGEDDRGARLLRRLSLGTALNKPSMPPPSAPATDAPPLPLTPRTPTSAKKMRRRTLAAEPPRRAPSPMGERILKGHFDGFS
ncbi:hypothetical protein SCHPADRAFT_550705 [Schizopora paradoxa]|uniref:Uncharacterized protein n=1 Tax=Schizopora paradoxa TaxID=27342 RepID=A0A0H2RDV7_9AGAM|nr:hypothetical protein SCHPADRAFT_550705 [Schizopora paradoxa]